MTIVTPTPIPAAPALPQSSDASTFDDLADVYLAWQSGDLPDGIDAQSQAAYENALATQQIAQAVAIDGAQAVADARTARDDAQDHAGAAVAAKNQAQAWAEGDEPALGAKSAKAWAGDANAGADSAWAAAAAAGEGTLPQPLIPGKVLGVTPAGAVNWVDNKLPGDILQTIRQDLALPEYLRLDGKKYLAESYPKIAGLFASEIAGFSDPSFNAITASSGIATDGKGTWVQLGALNDWRISRDDAQSWQRYAGPFVPKSIATDGNGNWFATEVESTYQRVWVSTDDLETWTKVGILIGNGSAAVKTSFAGPAGVWFALSVLTDGKTQLNRIDHNLSSTMPVKTEPTVIAAGFNKSTGKLICFEYVPGVNNQLKVNSSNDLGDTWTSALHPLSFSVSVSYSFVAVDGAQWVLCAPPNGEYHIASVDDGVTWAGYTSPRSIGHLFFTQTGLVSAIDKAFVVYPDGLGATRWKLLAPAVSASDIVRGASSIIAVSNTTIRRSVDNAVTFGDVITCPSMGRFASDQKGLLIGAGGATAWARSVNDGLSWASFVGPGAISGIDCDTDKTWIGVGSGATWYRSADGGETWNGFVAPGSASWILYVGNGVWLAGSSGTEWYRTTDNGDTWATITAPVGTGSRAMLDGRGNVLFCVANSAYLSADIGDTWKRTIVPAGVDGVGLSVAPGVITFVKAANQYFLDLNIRQPVYRLNPTSLLNGNPFKVSSATEDTVIHAGFTSSFIDGILRGYSIRGPGFNGPWEVIESPDANDLLVGGANGVWLRAKNPPSTVALWYRSIDDCRTWVEIPAPIALVHRMAASDTGVWLAWGQVGSGFPVQFFRSLDNGFTWEAVPTLAGNVAILWLGGQKWCMANNSVTENDGDTWFGITLPNGYSVCGSDRRGAIFASTILPTTGSSSVSWQRSVDLGRTWAACAGPDKFGPSGFGLAKGGDILLSGKVSQPNGYWEGAKEATSIVLRDSSQFILPNVTSQIPAYVFTGESA